MDFSRAAADVDRIERQSDFDELAGRFDGMAVTGD
jgi:hypothetical protein